MLLAKVGLRLSVRLSKAGNKIMDKGTGLTRIELLVVIAIVGFIALFALYAGIFMQWQSRVKRNAKAVQCMENLKEWSLIFAMYTEKNDGYFFSHEGSDSSGWWMNLLQPHYHEHQELLLCPRATKPYNKGGQNPFGAWNVNNNVGSYGINGWICNPKQGKTELQRHRPIEYYWRTSNIKGAFNIPVFLDCMWTEAWPRATDQPPEYEGWPGDKVIENYMKFNIDQMRRFCINRHQGFVNGLFMDWSVRKVGLKELWTLKWHRQYDTAGPWTRAGGVIPNDWPQWMRNCRDF